MSRFLLALCATLAVLQASPYLDQRIAYARSLIAKEKNNPQGYNDLAVALARRARETADPAYLKQAEEAVNESLRVAPGNFEGRRARAIVRIEQRRWADALEEATALNKGNPDDNGMYAIIADAQIALGNYTEAEAATQRMIDMRQVNAPALERGAKLREIFGYGEGAQEWWNSALRLTSASDTEERAWIATRLAKLLLLSGKAETAEKYLQQALAMEPDYAPALGLMAQARMAQEHPDEAIELYRKRLKISPDPETQYGLALALEKSGQAADAARAYAEFEKIAAAAAKQPGNANRDLILYYAGQGAKPKEAVRLGREELERRHDVYTRDALAWALYQTGEFEEASKQMEQALAPGIRDAGFFYHAGAIALKRNDKPAAKKYFKNSLEVDAGSPYSAMALKELAAIS